MALPEQIQESIDKASTNVRDAIAFAARTEHPIVMQTLSEVLTRLQMLENTAEFVEKFDPAKTSVNFDFKDFFDNIPD